MVVQTKGCNVGTHHVGNTIRDRVGMLAIWTYHHALNDVYLHIRCNTASNHEMDRKQEAVEYLQEDMVQFL